VLLMHVRFRSRSIHNYKRAAVDMHIFAFGEHGS